MSLPVSSTETWFLQIWSRLHFSRWETPDLDKVVPGQGNLDQDDYMWPCRPETNSDQRPKSWTPVRRGPKTDVDLGTLLDLKTFSLQYKTDLVPILKIPTRTIQSDFVYVVPDESDPQGRTVYLELTPPPEITYKTSPGTSQQMNVLGIVIFSATMGQFPPVGGVSLPKFSFSRQTFS